jgi:O-antigen/teichoic acid export membrane protein
MSARSVVRVYTSNLLSKVVLGGVGLLLVRFMEVRELALFTLAFSIITALSQPLVDIANRLFIVYRELGSDEERLVVVSILQVLVIASMGAALALTATPLGLLATIIAAMLAIVCFETAKTYYQAAQRFGAYWATECLRAFSYLGGVSVLILSHEGLTAANTLLAQAAAAFVVGAGALLLGLGHLDVLGCLRPRRLWKIAARLSLGNMLSGVLVAYIVLQSAMGQASVFILKAISTEGQLAAFGSAMRYYGFIILALSSLQTVLLPALRNCASADELGRVFRTHRRLLLLFVPAVVLCAVAALWFIPLIDRGRYPDAVPTFLVLCVSAVLSFSLGVYPILAVNQRRFRMLFCVSALAFLLCVGLNYVFVGWWGAVGAAFATLGAHAFFNGAIALSFWRHSIDRSAWALLRSF